MQIGKFSLSNPVFLAPMAGVTDPVFRTICSELGAGLTVSEMVPADTSLYASDKTLSRIAGDSRDGMPRSVQIVGSEPQKLAEAAMLNVKLGAEIIDINMGCPAKKVCRKLAGSALMADPPLVKRILRQTVAAVDVPVTLKIRTGTDRENLNGVEIARMAEKEGIQAIAVHGRTRADKFSGEAEYETIRAIKQNVGIPVIANGDIRSGADARQVLEFTGADAVMIGRASQGNPWIFRQVLDELQNHQVSKPPTAADVHRVLSRHLQGLYKLHGEYRGVRIARKHIAWYCRNEHGVASFRQAVNQAESIAEQTELLDRFFDEPAGWGAEPVQSRTHAA